MNNIIAITTTLAISSSYLPVSSVFGTSDQHSSKPNIIFILADDLGYMDVAYNGGTHYETPNIDQLAKDGLVFTNAYACGPMCSPTRAAFITGTYAPRHQIYSPGMYGTRVPTSTCILRFLREIKSNLKCFRYVDHYLQVFLQLRKL